ncbi:MAG: O-antigen ligase family protein [Pseudomonadota bacterium]
MTTVPVTSHSAPGPGLGTGLRSRHLVWTAACYDLTLAVMIIVAGSQGTYRFAPPLLLWLAIYIMLTLKFVTRLHTLFDALRQNIAILAFPVVAALSTVWSVAPGASAYAAMQLFMTYMAGFWIGWRYRPKDIAIIVLLALSPLIFLSLVNWATGVFGEVYSYSGGLLGVFNHKNILGRMSLLLGIVAIALLASRPSKFTGAVFPGCVLVLSGCALFLSKSATSTIVMLSATVVFVALTQRRYSNSVRLLMLGLGILAVAAVIVSIGSGGFDPIQDTLGTFGKSSTLTGRTKLWDFGVQEVSRQPWLGVGFKAYWDNGTSLAVDHIRRSFTDSIFSFHNFILDIWLYLGIPGLIAISITLTAIGASFVRYYVLSSEVWPAMALTLLFAGIGVAFFNPLLHGQHGNVIVILVALAVSAKIETARLTIRRPV